MDIEKIKALLIFAQNDMLRMTENAKLQKQLENIAGNNYAEGFHGGNIQAFDYACKHLTNILDTMLHDDGALEISGVICDLCNHNWVAVRPYGLEKLECPTCKNTTTFQNIIE